jgi:phosphoglucosamine mutase
VSDVNLFGTDGIRGQVFECPFLPSQLAELGSSIARVLKAHRNKMVIACDSRSSGDMIASSLGAGIMAQGMDVLNLGVMSTPSLAFLTKHYSADFGLMISASHNPYSDNGIKIFNAFGEKISTDLEWKISRMYCDQNFSFSVQSLGRLVDKKPTALRPYLDFLRAHFANLNLDHIRIAIDCANGALSGWAKIFLQELGAEVIAFANDPDGTNINAECGATHPATIQKLVTEHQANIGFAFDGDGDRIMAVNASGDLLDGDQILALLALDHLNSPNGTELKVVGTVMANLGLLKFLESNGVPFFKTQVGDKFVADKMTETKAQIGGEASGHIILSDYGMIGDGLLVALKLLSIYQRSQTLPLAFIPTGQKLENITVKNKQLLNLPEWQAFLDSLIQDHGQSSQILVRSSGTEPLIRIFVQCDNEMLTDHIISACQEKITELDSDTYII